jgi:hypothetical protein
MPESAQQAAQAKGRPRFEVFVEILGRRLASGKSVLREISIDLQRRVLREIPSLTIAEVCS